MILTVLAIGLLGAHRRTVPQLLVEGARQQLLVATTYDPAYVKIPYPNGDVPLNRGVCTDVVIRAYRHAGFDLQKLIHEDISAHRSAYPGFRAPDTSIDHRRVPYQAVFFRRHGATLTLSTDRSTSWLPGDVVDWKLPTGQDHTGVLTDKLDHQGFPFVIHNIGRGPMEEDVLRSWKITCHYRYPRSRG